MEKIMYKYVVTIDTTAWDDSIEEMIDNKSITEVIEIITENPLVARKNALEKAIKIEEVFKDPEVEHQLPPIKFGESFEGKEPLLYMLYEIKVAFEIDGKNYCIWTDTIGSTGRGGNTSDEEVFEGLRKEYEIFKKAGIDLHGNTKLVKYYEKGQKKQSHILPNGWDWNGIETDPLYGMELDLDDSDKKKKQKMPKKESKIKPKVDTKFKHEYKHTFNIKKDTIEISLKTTFKTIPANLENSINKFIQQLVSKK